MGQICTILILFVILVVMIFLVIYTWVIHLFNFNKTTLENQGELTESSANFAWMEFIMMEALSFMVSMSLFSFIFCEAA